MLERKDGMLRKYRLLLMEESMVREGGGREDDDIYKAISDKTLVNEIYLSLHLLTIQGISPIIWPCYFFLVFGAFASETVITIGDWCCDCFSARSLLRKWFYSSEHSTATKKLFSWTRNSGPKKILASLSSLQIKFSASVLSCYKTNVLRSQACCVCVCVCVL